MHTDEYAISISRELSVCKSLINRIERLIEELENKYKMKTDVFIREFKKGGMGETEDYILWRDKYAELKLWREMQMRYKDMLSLTCL